MKPSLKLSLHMGADRQAALLDVERAWGTRTKAGAPSPRKPPRDLPSSALPLIPTRPAHASQALGVEGSDAVVP